MKAANKKSAFDKNTSMGAVAFDKNTSMGAAAFDKNTSMGFAANDMSNGPDNPGVTNEFGDPLDFGNQREGFDA